MACVAVTEGTNNGKFIHHLRGLRDFLANLQARHVGGDRVERAANVTGRIGLQVEGVNGAQATLEKHVDEGHIVLGLVGLACYLCLKQLCE